MKSSPFVASMLACIILWAAPARAAIVGDADVSYAATRTLTVDNKSYKGEVFHAPGLHREDQNIQGVDLVFVLNIPEAKGIVMAPPLATYAEFPLPRLLAEIDSRRLSGKAVGDDIVGGLRATKYRLDYTASDGTRGEGFLWLSGENILVKLEGRIVRPGHRPTTIRMELSSIRRDKQNPDLFRIPTGMHRLPPEALEALLNLRTNFRQLGK
jgi:hypothetical protein